MIAGVGQYDGGERWVYDPERGGTTVRVNAQHPVPDLPLKDAEDRSLKELDSTLGALSCAVDVRKEIKSKAVQELSQRRQESQHPDDIAPKSGSRRLLVDLVIARGLGE